MQKSGKGLHQDSKDCKSHLMKAYLVSVGLIYQVGHTTYETVILSMPFETWSLLLTKGEEHEYEITNDDSGRGFGAYWLC